MINPKDVTIIIPHLGGTAEAEYSLDQCLESLKETTPDIKVLVAINGSRCIAHRKGEASITIQDQGQCKAVNAAIATTNTSWIMVTNDDMVYAPGWFEALVDYTDEFMCMSPKLVEPRDGAPTFIKYFCGGAGGDFDKEKFLDLFRNYSVEGSPLTEGFNLPFIMKRELWNTVGGYDVDYDPWSSNSDSDLEYKIKLAGVQPIQNQACLVYHFSQTSGTFNPENQAAWSRNFAYFEEKWGFPRTDNGIWEATFTIPDEGRKFRPEWEGKYGT